MSAFPAAYLVLITDLRSVHPVLAVAGVAGVPACGHAFRLQPGKNIIGRLPDDDIAIVLPVSDVSKRHAQVELLFTGGWELENLGSQNGTQVNGNKLQAHVLTPLKEDDRIRIGRVELAFSLMPDVKAKREPSPEDVEKWLLGPYLNGDH